MFDLKSLADERIGGSGRWDSTMAALAAASRSAAREASGYTKLMGVSGAAFRVQIHDGLCPSSPHACVGRACVDRAFDAIPLVAERCKGDDPKLRDWVRERLERGRAVVLFSFEADLILGTDADGGWLGRPYNHKEPGLVPIGEKPVFECVAFGSSRVVPSDSVLLQRAVRFAIESSAAQTQEGDYWTGRAAYRRWLELAATEMDEGMRQGSAFAWESLIDARRDAAAFLASEAERSSVAVAELSDAAAAYSRFVERFGSASTCSLMPYPWMKDCHWTPERRDSFLRALEEARDLDSEAINRLSCVAHALSK